MLEKILDKYYAKKLIDKLKNHLSIYNMDKKVLYKKDYFEIKIKSKKYRDEFYKTILILCYNECFDVYINGYESLLKGIKSLIESKGVGVE